MNRIGNHESELCALWHEIDALKDPDNAHADIMNGLCYCRHCLEYRDERDRRNADTLLPLFALGGFTLLLIVSLVYVIHP